MHQSVMKWVAGIVKKLGPLDGLSVLEVGSYNVNGSVRELFAGAEFYSGIDNREGKGVDVVMDAHDLRIDDACYDIVISTEMLEHDPKFWLSLAEMGRVLKPQGHLIITARGNGFPLHDYPGDFYRFMPEAIPELLKLSGCEVVDMCADTDKRMPGVFGWGRKRA